MRPVLIFFLFLLSTKLFSQIIITDSNNKPIPFVQVVSSNKYFFAQTNLKGELNWEDLEKLKDADTLFFHHVTYERVFKVKKSLLPHDTIKLQHRPYELKEFSVNAKKVNNKYQKLNICFRSYQANNDSMAFYTDGKAEYLSKINKDNYDLHLKEVRSFASKRIEDETPHRSVGISFLPTIPWPIYEYLPYQYAKKHQLKFQPDDEGKVQILYKDSIQLGEVEISPHYIKYSVNHTKSNSTDKAFKTEVNIKKFELIMLFRNYEGQELASIKNLDDLVYYKVLREYRVKHDKDKNYTKIFIVDEIFIEDIKYAESIGETEYNSSFGFPKKSNYKSEFWQSCDCEAYFPPYEQLIRGLYER